MGYPLRIQHEESIYFVTNRCLQERFLMQPDDPYVVQLCRGALVMAAKKHKVEVFTFVFMGNHYHLVVRAPLLNLDVFMQQFQGQLARRINRHRGRHGTFFGGRYTYAPILDQEQLAQKVVYTLLNPVAAGLVEHPRHWPGASAYEGHLSGQPIEGRWMDFEQVARYGRKHGLRGQVLYNDAILDDMFFDEMSLELAPLPLWEGEGLDGCQKAARLEQMVEEGLEVLLERDKPSLGDAGAKARCAVLQCWSARPKNPKRGGPKPLCHASSRRQRQIYRAYYTQCVQSYRSARAAFLAEPSLPHRFPHGMIPCVISKSLVRGQAHHGQKVRYGPDGWSVWGD